MTIKLVYSLLLIAVVSAANNDEVLEANEYMDTLLDNLRKDPTIAPRVEPILVPDIKRKNFEGKNIYIKGLSKLVREGDCIVNAGQDKTLIVANLEAKRITFKLNYRVKGGILPIWIDGTAEGKMDHISINSVISVASADSVGKVEKFEVVDFGRFRVTKVRGGGIVLEFVMQIITNHLLRRSKRMIIEGLEKGVAELFQEKLSEVKISARRKND